VAAQGRVVGNRFLAIGKILSLCNNTRGASTTEWGGRYTNDDDACIVIRTSVRCGMDVVCVCVCIMLPDAPRKKI